MANATCKRKVALFSDFSPPFFGGMENHASEFFRHFNASGRLARAFAMLGPKSSLARAQEIQPFLRDPLVELISQDSTRNPSEIISRMKEERLNRAALFFNSMYWVRGFGEIKKAFPESRIVLRSGGNDIIQAALMDMGDTLEKRQKYVVSQINMHVDCLIANSSYSRGRFEALGIHPEKILVAKGGVDISRFRPASQPLRAESKAGLGLPQERKLILSAVRFVPVKSVITMIRAAERLLETAGDVFTLLIAGDGPQEREIRENAEKSSASKNIILHKPVPFHSMHRYYSAADVYLQTSIGHHQEVEGGAYLHIETMGRTLCEAAASGIPAVATRVGGIPEVVEDGRTGFLVGPLDPDAAADAISIALFSGVAEGIGIEAREKAMREFAWEKVFEKYELALEGGTDA